MSWDPRDLHVDGLSFVDGPFGGLTQKKSTTSPQPVVVRTTCLSLQTDANFRRVGYFLGSPKIKELVYDMAQEGHYRDLVDLLHATARTKQLAVFGGELLEVYGHKRMVFQGVKIGVNQVKQLFRQGPGRPSLKKTCAGPTKQQSATVEHIVHTLGGKKILEWDSEKRPFNLAKASGVYVQPVSGINESWDALTGRGKVLYAIQYTRNPQHGISAPGMLALLNRLPPGMKLVILHLVPQERFDRYSWQPYADWVTQTEKALSGSGLKLAKTRKRVLSQSEVPPKLAKIEQWVAVLPLPEPDDDPLPLGDASPGAAEAAFEDKSGVLTGDERDSV